MPNKEPTPENIRPGMLFAERYRIERRLDTGGMATIYLAYDQANHDQSVAIKVLFGRYADDDVVRARFLDEGRIQSMLDHPNIVHVHRVISDPVLSFVMEYIDGETLEEYLQREAPLDEHDILDLVMPVMSAVGFAHSKGIVHRDLKPSNVLLSDQTGYLEPKVMDFGVAKVSHGKDLTAAGTTVGTLHYMSPEQIVGSRDIDGRADIYSLGCSLYKLCTGDVPFNASTEFALMMAQVEAPPTPPSQLRDDISDQLEQLILRALAKEPEHRFQTIKEMTTELMQLGDRSGQRNTVTRPIPADLLQFAMDADEVVRDQTDEVRLAPTTTDQHPEIGAEDIDEAARTLELSTAAVKEIESDRLRAQRRKSGTTRSLPNVETDSSGPNDTIEQQAIDPGEDLRSTERQDLDALETRPDEGFDAEQLKTTIEQPRPEIDDSTETLERPEPTDLSNPSNISNPDTEEDRRGVIAVDNPDVDSREITGLMEKSDLESGPTDEYAPSDSDLPSSIESAGGGDADSSSQQSALKMRRPREATRQTDVGAKDKEPANLSTDELSTESADEAAVPTTYIAIGVGAVVLLAILITAGWWVFSG